MAVVSFKGNDKKKSCLLGRKISDVPVVVCIILLIFAFSWMTIVNKSTETIIARAKQTTTAVTETNTETEIASPSTNEGSSTSLASPKKKEEIPYEYIPASTEDYIMTHMKELEFDREFWGVGCKIFESPANTTQENYDNLQGFRQDLDKYNEAVTNFDDGKTKDIMKKVRTCGQDCDIADICKAARPHPDGIQALFPSKQLSWTKAGFVEPLLTPMRNPSFCDDTRKPPFDIDYIVHDFEAMCLNLKPHSQLVLIDMGAALNFHSSGKQPVISLMKTFEKFGFYFDHIYAFEVTEFDAKKVYQDILPKEYLKAYHWINAGVSADKDSKMNPLYSIISEFSEDDLIIVKLDIDTAEIENPLAQNLLEDDSVNKLVDHFYFEHHVFLYEMRAWWGKIMKGTVEDTFNLMNGLRKKGVASHFWV